MRHDRNQALKLRLAGKSYAEIRQLLGVPKGTLSGWFSNLELSPVARARIQNRVYKGSLQGLLKRNKNQTHLAIQRMRHARNTASQEIAHLTKNELKLLGIALYWAEGYKRRITRNGREVTHHSVALTNSDPILIIAFLKFLREICEVAESKITAEIRIYEHINERNALRFWQKTTQLPVNNFRRFYYGVSKSSQGKRPFKRLPYGTLMIRVNSTKLYHTIMGWIEGVSQQIE